MKSSSDPLTFRQATRNMADAAVLTDPSGHITWANKAFERLCGYSHKEIANQKPGDLLQGKETNPETVQKIHQAIATKSHVCVEILNYHKDGHSYWASIAISPIKNKLHELEGFIAIERDITEKNFELSCLKSEISQMYQVLIHQEQRLCTSNEDALETE